MNTTTMALTRSRYTTFLLAVCLLLVSVVNCSEGKTLVVSVAGDDANSGDERSPLRTISHAASLAQPGDVVLVKEGVYRERVAPPRGGQPGRPITYRAASGERVVVKGSEEWSPEWIQRSDGVYSAVPDPSLFNDRSNEYLDGHNPFKVQLSSTPWKREGLREYERREAGESRIGRCDPRIVYTCGQVFVNGEQYLEVPLKEELEPGAWWYDAEAGSIFVHFGSLAPADQTVEITTRRRLFAPVVRGLGHIVVEGFVFEHCGNQYPTNFWSNDAYAQKGAVGTEAGHHWVIRKNVVRYAKTFAIDVGRVDRHNKPDEAHDNLVEENYIVDNGSAGVLSNGSLNLVVRRNVILRNNTLRFSGVKRWEQAAIKCHHFKRGLIESNYIADNHDTYGVWLDNQFPDSRVSRNVIVDNGAAGIFLEMSDYGFDRLLVDNNILVGNKEHSVYIHDASGATFEHNLFANTVPTSRRNQAVYIRQAMARTKSYHHSFFNNLFLGSQRNVDVNYPAARSGIQRFEANVYSVSNKLPEFSINDQSDKPSPWSEEEFRTLVRSDLQGVPAAAGMETSDGKAPMTLELWKAFWEKHGQANDAQSRLCSGASVEYDRSRHLLELSIDFDPLAADSVAHSKIATDFFGETIPSDAAPGPFQSLQRGGNEFMIWSGLPVIDEGQLPPDSWTL